MAAAVMYITALAFEWRDRKAGIHSSVATTASLVLDQRYGSRDRLLKMMMFAPKHCNGCSTADTV